MKLLFILSFDCGEREACGGENGEGEITRITPFPCIRDWHELVLITFLYTTLRFWLDNTLTIIEAYLFIAFTLFCIANFSVILTHWRNICLYSRELCKLMHVSVTFKRKPLTGLKELWKTHAKEDNINVIR